jgi:bacterioferritin-associated ferredoxin
VLYEGTLPDFSVSGSGLAGNPANGDVAKLFFSLDGEERVITLAWEAHGSVLLQGVLSWLVSYAPGKTLDALLLLDTPMIVELLGGLPDKVLHVAEHVKDLIRVTANSCFVKKGERVRVIPKKKALPLCDRHDITDSFIRQHYLRGTQRSEEILRLWDKEGNCSICQHAVEDTLEALRREFPMNGQVHLR